MLFNSLDFLIFFPIVVSLYFAMPYRYRWIWLLAASYYFYAAWRLEYLGLIIISTVIGYVTALQMGQQAERSGRRKYLLISLCSNLGILFAFKYFNFFNDSTRALFNQFNLFYDVPAFQVLLPIGISFYTFQILSYTIDVYRGRIEPERCLGVFALFIAFFPQLVAGPIERAGHMLPQFYQKHDFEAERAISGLRLMLWGLFKKVVIADRLGVYANAVYNSPGDWEGWPIILATYFFAFQIYCDFSGYSDIAIGAARFMGYDLMDNFKQPYFARSIGEFWGRWHISLSTWFRDYLYIPLGGNRVSIPRWYINLMIVFLVSGLWHGANWTFALWGGLHGLYLILEIVTGPWKVKLAALLRLQNKPTVQSAISILLTFHLTYFAWIFFRANSLSDAFLLIDNLTHLSASASIYAPWESLVNNPGLEMALSAGLILLLLAVQGVQVTGLNLPLFFARPLWLRWAAYLFLALAILNLGITAEAPFIYFQF